MNRASFFVFAVTVAVASCKSELDPNDSTVENNGPANWELVMTIETALNSDRIMQTSMTAALLDASGPAPVAVALQLDSGDNLQVSDGAQTVVLEALEDEERVYAGEFPAEVAGQNLTVSLMKTTPPTDVDWWVPTGDSPQPDFNDFFINAPNTQVQLPPPFTIDAPTYIPDPDPPTDGSPPDDFREEFPLGTDVTITWSPSNSGASMRLIYGTTCGSTQSPLGAVNIEGDPGTFTAEVDDFLTGQSDAAKQDEDGCIIRLTLERQTDDGNLTPDPALSADSNLVARYRRFIEIKSIPSS